MMTAPRDPRAELLRCGDVEANPGPGPSVVPPGLQELGGRRGPPSRSGRRSVSQGPTVEEQVKQVVKCHETNLSGNKHVKWKLG